MDTIIGAIIGAVAALLGAWVSILGVRSSNKQSHDLNQSAEHERYLREKIEELAALSTSIPDWIESFEDNMFEVPPKHTANEPMERIYILCSLYFPNLWNDAHPLCDAARAITKLMIDEAGLRLANKGMPSDDYGTKYLPLNQRLIDTQKVFIDKLSQYVKKQYT